LVPFYNNESTTFGNHSVSFPNAFNQQKPGTAPSDANSLQRTFLSATSATNLKHHKPLTDHKPLTYALHNSLNRHSPREICHLDFISQSTTDLRHVSGNANPVVDALSRIATLTPSSTIDFDAMACAQHHDEELNKIRNDSSSSTTELRDHPIPTSKNHITCDISTGKPRPFVPKAFRRTIFNSLHNLSHPGIKATQRLITERYVWPSINRDVRQIMSTMSTLQSSTSHLCTYLKL
jgi:hypothetical protein